MDGVFWTFEQLKSPSFQINMHYYIEDIFNQRKRRKKYLTTFRILGAVWNREKRQNHCCDLYMCVCQAGSSMHGT